MTRYDKADMADPIKATTLTSLVDYIKKYLEDALEGIENREQITIIA